MQSWAITNKPKSGPYHNLGYYRVISAFTHLQAVSGERACIAGHLFQELLEVAFSLQQELQVR